MGKRFNIIWAVIFTALTIASLYGAIVKGATHQFSLAIITSGLTWACLADCKKCKTK